MLFAVVQAFEEREEIRISPKRLRGRLRSSMQEAKNVFAITLAV